MICYLDSSVVLRNLFGQRQDFKDWKKIDRAASSRLLEIECCRVIQCHRLENWLNDQEVADMNLALRVFLRGLTLFKIDDAVLDKAAEPFPTALGTLDAIHLSTAMLWQNMLKKPVVVLTHDKQLQIAAQAAGLTVIT